MDLIKISVVISWSHCMSLHVCHPMSYYVTPCVTPCQVMSNHVTPCVTPCQIMSHHVTPCVTSCVTPCQVMSCHVTPCVTSWHLCYIVDLILLMCKLSWLLQELPVLYKPVFLEHLLTSEELQLQKQPILPLKWNDTHSQVIFCAVRCLVKISFKCLKGLMGILSYNETFFL